LAKIAVRAAKTADNTAHTFAFMASVLRRLRRLLADRELRGKNERQ